MPERGRSTDDHIRIRWWDTATRAPYRGASSADLVYLIGCPFGEEVSLSSTTAVFPQCVDLAYGHLLMA